MKSVGHDFSDTQKRSADAQSLTAIGHLKTVNHVMRAGGSTFAPVHRTSANQLLSDGGLSLTAIGLIPSDAHVDCADGSTFAPVRIGLDAHNSNDGGTPIDSGQCPDATRGLPAGVELPTPQSEARPVTETTVQPLLTLRVWAEMFNDVQKSRIACVNRAERGGVDKDVCAIQVAALEAAENEMRKALVKEYRRVVPTPIRAWQQESRGIGEHLLARLLGCVGHPVYTTPHHWEGDGEDRKLIAEAPMERRISDLWSYCGHGDATRKRRKGMTWAEGAATGNPQAKMLTHLLAEACMKAGGPYREVYDRRRAVNAERHPEWTAGHSHNDALRIVGKAILKDLWIVARG